MAFQAAHSRQADIRRTAGRAGTTVGIDAQRHGALGRKPRRALALEVQTKNCVAAVSRWRCHCWSTQSMPYRKCRPSPNGWIETTRVPCCRCRAQYQPGLRQISANPRFPGGRGLSTARCGSSSQRSAMPHASRSIWRICPEAGRWTNVRVRCGYRATRTSTAVTAGRYVPGRLFVVGDACLSQWRGAVASRWARVRKIRLLRRSTGVRYRRAAIVPSRGSASTDAKTDQHG